MRREDRAERRENKLGPSLRDQSLCLNVCVGRKRVCNMKILRNTHCLSFSVLSSFLLFPFPPSYLTLPPLLIICPSLTSFFASLSLLHLFLPHFLLRRRRKREEGLEREAGEGREKREGEKERRMRKRRTKRE